jgi:hypothetical protein
MVWICAIAPGRDAENVESSLRRTVSGSPETWANRTLPAAWRSASGHRAQQTIVVRRRSRTEWEGEVDPLGGGRKHSRANDRRADRQMAQLPFNVRERLDGGIMAGDGLRMSRFPVTSIGLKSLRS